MAALKLLQKNRGSDPQKHIDDLRKSVDIQVKPAVKKRVKIKPTPEFQPPEPKSPLEKPRRKPKRTVDIQNITTSKDMYGPDGPNAILQKMYSERHAIPLDEMPSFFKNYMVNIDRDKANRVSGTTIETFETRSPNGAFKWLDLASKVDRQ